MPMMRNATGKIGAMAGGLALAVAVIGGWEGLRLTAYPDRLAGNIPTVCYGETRGVRLGDSYTQAECDTMLQRAIVEFETGLDRCMNPPSQLPMETKVAFVSWSYNVGIGAACGSTLVRLVNRGDYVAACNQLPRWNRAGGVVVRGLSNRRQAEQQLCLHGLTEDSSSLTEQPAEDDPQPVNLTNPPVIVPSTRPC